MFSCYHATDKEKAKRVEEKYKPLLKKVEYASLAPDDSTLDGKFSAKQLRLIADAMDELRVK